MISLNPNQETFFDVETWYQDSQRSVAFVMLEGQGKKIKNNASTMTYEVVSGAGMFEIEGQGTVFIGAEDEFEGSVIARPSIDEPGSELSLGNNKVTIEAGTVYQDFGYLVMLATSEPPFDASSVEIIED